MTPINREIRKTVYDGFRKRRNGFTLQIFTSVMCEHNSRIDIIINKHIIRMDIDGICNMRNVCVHVIYGIYIYLCIRTVLYIVECVFCTSGS